MIVLASMTSCFLPVTVAAVASATVDPQHGVDSPACASQPPCRTVAYAVQVAKATNISLAAGVFNEPTVSISNVASLVISGTASASIFNCSDRLQSTGAAFSIANSTVIIMDVTFFQCANPNANGGAVSASGSSVVVLRCRFVNCSAASGGAISVAGPGSLLFLRVHGSEFERNSALGGASGCPEDAAQPCSSWGGAIAAFEIPNVTVSACTMVSNIARASVPRLSPQNNASRNAVAGGGCVSVLFFGSASDTALRVFSNRFVKCEVAVSFSDNVTLGNGASAVHLHLLSLERVCCLLNAFRAGYGGAVSLYFGLSSSLQQLDVSSVKAELVDNGFEGCAARVSTEYGGNSYGGAVSIYVGGYSSVYNARAAAAFVGGTAAQNVSVALHDARLSSCSAERTSDTNSTYGGSVYGGSFSLYIGSYAWSFSTDGSSSSAAGATAADNISVSISNASCFGCSAVTSSQNSLNGANSYGGSMSVLYVGAYAWSFSGGALVQSSRSVCFFTRVIGLNVSVETSDIRLSRALSRALPCVQHRLSSRSCFRSSWKLSGCKCALFSASFALYSTICSARSMLN